MAGELKTGKPAFRYASGYYYALKWLGGYIDGRTWKSVPDPPPVITSWVGPYDTFDEAWRTREFFAGL